jgi:hypothetical protein
MQFGYGEAAGVWGRLGNLLTELVIGHHSPRFRLSSASPIHYYGLLHADLARRYLEVTISGNVISCQRMLSSSQEQMAQALSVRNPHDRW